MALKEGRDSNWGFVVWCFRPMLPSADAAVESDGFDIPDGQTLMSRLQWEDSPDISPTDSSSSKASKEASVRLRQTRLGYVTHGIDAFLVALTGTNHSDSRRPKKKKKSLSLNSTGGGGGGGGGGGLTGGSSSSCSNISQMNISLSTKKKRPKLSAPPISSIYDELN